jgi:two-component system response regulator YesN
MLVDNEPVIPKGLMQMIDWRAVGCRVNSVASDGMDAVQKIREAPPDIVITDIRMPEMSGLELCAWIRQHYPAVQIILLTGFPDFEYAQQAIQYQVVDFV